MWSSQMLWPASWSRWVAFMVPPLPALHRAAPGGLELALRPDAIQERPDAPDLRNGAGDEVLPAETGIDGHHEDEAELREDPSSTTAEVAGLSASPTRLSSFAIAIDSGVRWRWTAPSACTVSPSAPASAKASR